MTQNERPLSPHLQVYRWELPMAMSILHRVTGVALSAGLLLLVYWLVAAAVGGQVYDTLQSYLGTLIGRLLLLGWTVSLFYHLGNGIRHLFWDAGLGFEMSSAYRSGWAVLAFTAAATAASWILGLSGATP